MHLTLEVHLRVVISPNSDRWEKNPKWVIQFANDRYFKTEFPSQDAATIAALSITDYLLNEGLAS